jgi:hypothetical protein
VSGGEKRLSGTKNKRRRAYGKRKTARFMPVGRTTKPAPGICEGKGVRAYGRTKPARKTDGSSARNTAR